MLIRDGRDSLSIPCHCFGSVQLIQFDSVTYQIALSLVKRYFRSSFRNFFLSIAIAVDRLLILCTTVKASVCAGDIVEVRVCLAAEREAGERRR